MRRHLGFSIFFSCLLLLFFGKLLLLKEAFLFGDYFDQFYPWSKIYAAAVKNLSLPFWTGAFHSGFPLVAEGQVGAFYPLNWIFFFFLPLRAAYNYIVVFHFLIAGVFTYLYSRKIGAGEWGGALSSLLFCFGSAYAGCFYNTVTVKTLIWVPLVLLLLEHYFDKKNIKYILLAGIVAGVQLTAGFVQMAMYSILFYALYYISGIWGRGEIRTRDIVYPALGILLAVLVFLPQLLLTIPLAGISGRGNATLGFALWGSFDPMNFVSIVLPSWIFRGARLYISIFGFLFLLSGLTASDKEKKLLPIKLMLIVSVFLALGKYNPLYVLMLKATGFYGLRNPSKILFFGIFAASILSGYGLTYFYGDGADRHRRKIAKLFSVLVLSMLGIFFAAKTFLTFGKGWILGFGRWYVTNFVHGKEFHRYDLDTYMDKVDAIYEGFIRSGSLTNIYLIASILICVIALLFCLSVLRKNGKPLMSRTIVLFVAAADLYIFSFYGTGFRGNLRGFDFLEPTHRRLFDEVKEEAGLFRILPFGLAGHKLPNWAKPNANAVFDVDSVAAYSPLVSREYAEALSGLECVDTSLGLLAPSSEALVVKLDLLRAMNVKYVVSSIALDVPGLIMVGEEGGVYLYVLKDTLPRVYATEDISIVPRESLYEVEVLSTGTGRYSISIVVPFEGYMVLSEFMYPGWRVYVDGVERDLFPFEEILMAVQVKDGDRDVLFVYDPAKAVGR